MQTERHGDEQIMITLFCTLNIVCSCRSLCGNLIHAKKMLELWIHGFITHVKYRHVIKTILLMSLTLSLYLAK